MVVSGLGSSGELSTALCIQADCTPPLYSWFLLFDFLIHDGYWYPLTITYNWFLYMLSSVLLFVQGLWFAGYSWIRKVSPPMHSSIKFQSCWTSRAEHCLSHAILQPFCNQYCSIHIGLSLYVYELGRLCRLPHPPEQPNAQGLRSYHTWVYLKGNVRKLC